MKKTSKILAVVLVVALAIATLAIFAACGESGEVTGECHYTNYGHEYGVKVTVTVKNDKITEVKLYSDEESGYVRTSSTWKENQNPGDLGYTKAEAAYESWIDENIVGQKINTILGWVATAAADDQSVGAGEKLTGATQSSARIIVAVQNALCNLKSVTKVTGECKYTSKYGDYGVKLDAFVRSNKIVGVRLYTKGETGWTRTSATWTEGQNAGDLGYAKTEAAYATYITEQIIGQKVKTVMSWEATATAEGQTVTEGEKIAGATQSSARIIVALQDALGKL